jgi:hypothetical protein
LVNTIAPNPYAQQVIFIAEIAQALIIIVINSYDVINGNGDALSAIIEIVACVAELTPLTGVQNAEQIRRQVYAEIKV